MNKLKNKTKQIIRIDMTEYKQEFIDLICQCSSNEYIGLGKPNAKILLVGKEVATNPYSKDPLEEQNMVSYLNNVKDWEKNKTERKQQEDVEYWVFEMMVEFDKSIPCFINI